MPVIPTYNSKRNITANTQEPLRREAADSFAPARQVTDTLTQVTNNWKNAVDTMEQTKAIANYEVGAAQIQSEAANDPDYNNAPVYKQKLAELKEKTIGGISSGLARQNLGIELDKNVAINSIKIDADFMGKRIAEGKVNAEVSLAAILKKKVNASTEAERIEADNEIDALVSANKSVGILTPEEAHNIKENTAKQVAWNLISQDPVKGLEILKSDVLPLTGKDKTATMNSAWLLIERNKKIEDIKLEINTNQSIIDLSKAMVDGTLTPAMVENSLAEDKVKSIYHSIATKKDITYPDSTEVRDANYFLNLLEESSMDDVKVDKILTKVAKLYSENKIGSNQLAYFVDNMQDVLNDQKKFKVTMNPDLKKVFSAVKGMTSAAEMFFSKKNKNEIKNSMISAFFDNYKKGSDPNALVDTIVNETAKLENEYMTKYPQYDKDGEPIKYFIGGKHRAIIGYDKNKGGEPIFEL